MNQASNLWGIELNGADEDKNVWRMMLKPPSDPFVEEVKDERGNYLALRSTWFDGVTSSKGVHKLAKKLFSTLNVVMSVNGGTDPITNGAVVEFGQNGRPRRTHHLEANDINARARVSMPELTVTDAQGNVIEPPPAPSRAQLWMSAATLNSKIASALRYLEGNPSWGELYKAYEAVEFLPTGGISKREIKRFTRTANAGNRHREGKFSPHPRPMKLWEARALITAWVSAAIDDILTKNPE
ncbi:MAG: hypothetical protein GY788_08560 [bacterium]|nr:hypothetical protein [bacterium]